MNIFTSRLFCLLLLITISLNCHADATINVGGLYYIITPDGTAKVTYQPGNGLGYKAYTHAEVTIPSNITYNNKSYRVTTIGREAFKSCEYLYKVNLPNTIETIERLAFYYCTNLQKVIVPDIAAWCSFNMLSGNPILYYSRHLYKDEQTEITELVIPEGVTIINPFVFYYCEGLTSVTFPESLTTIAKYAFAYNMELTNIIIPSNVISIDDNAFYGAVKDVYVLATEPPIIKKQQFWVEWQQDAPCPCILS